MDGAASPGRRSAGGGVRDHAEEGLKPRRIKRALDREVEGLEGESRRVGHLVLVLVGAEDGVNDADALENVSHCDAVCWLSMP